MGMRGRGGLRLWVFQMLPGALLTLMIRVALPYIRWDGPPGTVPAATDIYVSNTLQLCVSWGREVRPTSDLLGSKCDPVASAAAPAFGGASAQPCAQSATEAAFAAFMRE